MNKQLSILIITYNRPADLLELLKNMLTQQGYADVVHEVLVLNNASTDNYDGVTAFIDGHPELKARYIWSGENLGVARGRNKLMPMAAGDILLSIDDDMVFTQPGDLATLATLFDDPFFAAANTAIITFRVIYYDTRDVQVTAFPHKQYDKYASRPHFLTYYFAGGAHIMRRDMLAATGLYPTDFHYGMEEYDLAYRAIEAGYTMGYDNRVTVAHKESPLGRAPGYRKIQMQWINKSKVAWRYLPFTYFVTTVVSWGFQYIRTVKGRPGAFFAAIAAILRIPFTERRRVINKKALQYLHDTEARLKY